MLSFQRLLVLIMAVVITVTAAAQNNRREMTVEESYLQESIEMMIIRETARSETREQKLIALEYINEAINRGSTNDEIRQTLEYLSREGIRSQARESGRLMNNFPDVRRQSAKYLGQLATDEARKALMEIVRYENEPMVLMEAIKALGDIGTNVNNDAVLAIAYVVNKFTSNKPDNLVALATIETFEKIARKNDGLKSQEAIQTLLRITDGTYIPIVKERARQALAELRSN